MNKASSRAAIALIKFVLPVLLIAYLLWRIEPAQWEVLGKQEKNLIRLGTAILVALAGVSVSLLRWSLLVRCQGIPLRLTETFRLGAIGFLLSFVSAGSVGGDVFKAIFLARRAPGKRLEAVASVFVDRALGMYGLLVVVAAALLIAPPAAAPEEFNQIVRGVALLTIVGTLSLLVLVSGGKWIDSLLQRFTNILWIGPPLGRIAAQVRLFHDHPWFFGSALLMSLAVHSLLTLSVYLIATGLFPRAPTLAEHLIIVPVGMVAAALPISPAGLGVFEAAIEWLYQVVPQSPTDASGTLVALVFELVKILLAFAGLIFYWTADRELRRSLQGEELEEV